MILGLRTAIYPAPEAAVLDPFGNRFGIIENPNFKISEVR